MHPGPGESPETERPHAPPRVPTGSLADRRNFAQRGNLSWRGQDSRDRLVTPFLSVGEGSEAPEAGLRGRGRLAGPAAGADGEVEAEAGAEALDPGGVPVGPAGLGAAANGGEL